MPKAVFAGCARSCAPFLDGVLANVEALGSTYDSFQVIIVENDSNDDTRDRLQRYAEGRANVRLIDADGLERTHPKRTDRIAIARNRYIEALAEPQYGDCDDLVILDFDDVNCRAIDPAAFMAARGWLWQEPDRRAVFANSSLFYYDIWALRHPSWSPDDCWARVRAEQAALGKTEAVRRHVAARQIPIAATEPPIVVHSAFGGLGIYRREAALAGSYVGLDSQGEEICEHVTFNAGVKGEVGVLGIFPALRNHAPLQHIISNLGGAKAIELEQGGKKWTLVGPADQPLQNIRRFPALARIVTRHDPNATFIDAAASVGDSIARARLAGARMPVIAMEASLTHAKFLWANMQRLPRLFGKTHLVWGHGGIGESGSAGPVRLEQLAGDEDVSLVKADADVVETELQFLRAKQPVLWLKAQTINHEARGRSLLGSLAAQWPEAIVFDVSGSAVAAGETGDLVGYYGDVALFPRRFHALHEEFRRSIPELSA